MRLFKAIKLYLGTKFTWRTAWRQAVATPRYHVVARDGFLFIEPR
jgi:hypothetical protein